MTIRRGRSTLSTRLATVRFGDGSTLSFIDRRRMGRMWLAADQEEGVGKLGPEPLAADFTVDVLAGLMARHRAPIKAVLCDQGIIAGVGNMDADEARRTTSSRWRTVLMRTALPAAGQSSASGYVAGGHISARSARSCALADPG